MATSNAEGVGTEFVSVVTGGANGIGRACALRLAAGGSRVVVADIADAQIDSAVRAIESVGGAAWGVHADATSILEVGQATRRIMERFGRIDVLVNNVGSPMAKGLLHISAEEWQAALDINLTSCFAWSRAVAPHMLDAGRGRMVNVSSLNALTGGVTSAVSKFAYAAAKAGVLGITRSLAKELGPAIAVNAVCPGIIKTELTAELLAEREAELSSGISLGRIGTPEDVASAVVFFAMAEPNYITGQYLVVDGGQWVT